MKKVNGRYYKALYVSGSGEAALDHRESINVETVKKAIDARNKRAIDHGYKPDQYIITLTTWENVFDDNGLFVESNTVEKAVTIYPETL